MTLATRCTACGTVFRVVEDQLRVSAGWVRCGRCQAVFNAAEHLVDVGPDSPPGPIAPGVPSVYRDRVLGTLERVSGRGTQSAAGGAAPARPVVSAAPTHEASETPETGEPPRAQNEDTGFGLGAPAPTAARGAPAEPDLPAAPGPGAPPAWPAGSAAIIRARFPSDETPARDAEPAPPAPVPDALDAGPVAQAGAADTRAGVADAQAGVADTGAAAPQEGDRDGASPVPAALPAFVRRADRAARWRRPGVRAALSVLALAAAALLAGQAAWMHHDLIAARWPAAEPALARLCSLAACTIEPPRRIDALAVVSSSLVRDTEPGSYRLTVTLGNRERLALRLPAFDLVLSDAQGRLLVRRVLQAAELGAAGDRIGAGAELALEARLHAGDAPVVGYAVEIFYP